MKSAPVAVIPIVGIGLSGGQVVVILVRVQGLSSVFKKSFPVIIR